MRIFQDANILFPAVKSRGAVHDLLWQLQKKRRALAVDAYVIAEAERNLEAKFAEALPELDAVLKTALRLPTQSSHARILVDLEHGLPEKDQPQSGGGRPVQRAG